MEMSNYNFTDTQKESCAVYGMPRSIVASGLTNQIEPVENVADAILKPVG